MAQHSAFWMAKRAGAAVLTVVALGVGVGAKPPTTPQFARLLALDPDEGVFAYARISPDGKTLVYASQPRNPNPRGGNGPQVVTVVDLATRKVQFTERGIDAYWSLEGDRMIYSGQGGVAIRHDKSGDITRDVAPSGLGDYYSWAKRDGKDLILTITSRYYYLDGDKGVMPAGRVTSCPGIGTGDRPLISKDGKRITTFVRGTVVVRNLTDCDFIFDTGIKGAKADFSWDGRYVAFHAPKPNGDGYEIEVVDLALRTIRTVTNFAGSSLFPSWTRDGRLCFRYDGDDYRGFMMISDVLSAPARPLPQSSNKLPERRGWTDLFPETERPHAEFSLVLIWGAWSAHAPYALDELTRARDSFSRDGMAVAVTTATDIGSFEPDVQRLLQRHSIDLPRIPLAPRRFVLTEATNQNPTTLLFRGGKLIDRRLGAQSADELTRWIRGYSAAGSSSPSRSNRH